MTARSVALRLLLALALVLALQAGALHRLSHATGQAHGLAQESACEACLALAALDEPIVAQLRRPAPSSQAVAEAPAVRHVAAAAASVRPGYRSRAPPLPTA